MSKTLRVLIFVCVLGLACSLGVLVAMVLNNPAERASQNAPSIREIGLEILPFNLIDQDGNPADESQLKGQWTVVDFIFTNCVGACPVMTARMVQAAERLEGKPVKFASFSLDEKRDTPDRLREFAKQYEINFDRWTFYTGNDEQTRQMVREGLMLIVDEDAGNEIPLDDGTTMNNIQHPTRLFLVAPDLRVVGLYSSGDPAEIDRLVADVESYLSEE